MRLIFWISVILIISGMCTANSAIVIGGAIFMAFSLIKINRK